MLKFAYGMSVRLSVCLSMCDVLCRSVRPEKLITVNRSCSAAADVTAAAAAARGNEGDDVECL